MTPRRTWLPGLTAGAWTGFALVEVPLVGLLLVGGLVAGAILGRSAAFLGGAFLGSGGIIGLVLVLMNANCAGLFGTEGGSCTPPDHLGWLLAAAAQLAIGTAAVTVSAVGAWRERAR